jgi:tetratricopeptide (TPR) repeat protein
MAESSSSTLRVTAEQRRAATGQFERANQVLTTGNQEYGIQLLVNCCQLDPASLIYRQALRKAVKAKYQNNLRGSRFAFLSNARMKLRIRAALKAEQYLQALEYAEQVFLANPWDVGTHLAMAEAFEGLGLIDQAVWTLEQARQTDNKHLKINRALAQVYEKRGNFTQAMALWELVRKAAPRDQEAQNKAKDLAASATIARGKYEEAIQAAAARKTDAEAETVEHGALEATHPTLTPVEERCARETAPLLAKINDDPKSPNTYLQLAAIYKRADHLDQAKAILEQGLGPTGNHFELALQIAELAIEPFRRDLAVTEQKLRKKPQDAELSKIRARLSKEINTRELALFQQKADRYPTEMGHRFEVGVRLLRAGQLDEAIRELQAARSDPRFFGKALVYLGYCFKNRHNWRLAQRNFEEALQHLPPGEDALRKEIMFQVAQGCAEAGDFAHAVEMGYELANLDFGFRNIGRLLDDWQARLQNA